MIDYPLGVSLTELDDGFLLRRTADNAGSIEFLMSQDELLALKATIDLWASRALTRVQAGSGTVHPVIVHPIARALIETDAMQANVLMTLAAPTGEQMTFEMPPPLAQYIATEIPTALAAMPPDATTKQ